MLSLNSVDKNYIKLAQVVYILRNMWSYEKRNDRILAILNSDYDVNYAIPNDSPVQYSEPDFLGNTALHFVIRFDRTDTDSIVRQLLSRGADFTCKNNEGLTPLLLADKYRTRSSSMIGDLLRAHIKYNNPINPQNKKGISHLYLACQHEKENVVEFFFKSGVSANQAVGLDSPLHSAVNNRNKEIIQLLIEHGADCNHLNANGTSPIHSIIECKIESDSFPSWDWQKEYESILDVMLFRDGYSLNSADCLGLSNFHIYCTKKFSFKSEDLEKFLDAGVDINSPVNFDSKIWPGYSALHFAAHFGIRIVVLLMKKGANLLAKDAKGITPLDLCLKKYKPIKISRILKTQETLRSIQFQNGTFLVDLLDLFGTKDKFEGYLKNADVNTTIPFDSPLWPGFTILHTAAMLSQNEHSDFYKIKLCLKYGADVMIQDARGMTAIHINFQKRLNTRLISDAHSYKTSFNPVDEYNISHFHIACMSWQFTKLDEFFSNGVNPNMPILIDLDDIVEPSWERYDSFLRIRTGSTPLHIALAFGFENIARWLLEHGANPMLLDADGFSCLHKAFHCICFSKELNHLLWIHPKSLESNPVAPGGLSHFHVACFMGNLSAVQTLLPLVTDINGAINNEVMKYVQYLQRGTVIGDTPLHLAIKSFNCSVELIDLLLNNGADIGLKNEDGLNPIYVALFESDDYPSSPEIIQRLELEILNKTQDICMKSKSQDISMIKKLLNGKKLNLFENYAERDEIIQNQIYSISCHTFEYIKDDMEKVLSIRFLEEQELFIYKDGLSSFHVSCSENDFDSVEKLIQLGVDIDAPKDYFSKEKGGYTGLHFAVDQNSERVVELLLKHGANIALQDSLGNTSVHLAALKHPCLIKILLRSTEFDFKIRNALGETVLDVLLKNTTNDSDTFSNLLKNESFLESIDLADKMRIVQDFSCRFFGDVFQSLIECVPNLTDVDNDGRNVIHYISGAQNNCTRNQLMDNLIILEDNGCELDCQDKQGKTPLYSAAFACNKKNVRTLLLMGADINIKDIRGKTPYSWVLKADYSSILEILTDYIHRLKSAGLQIDPINDDHKCTDFSADLSEMKETNLTKSLTLRDILTERFVMRFPLIPRDEREAVLSLIGLDHVLLQFPKWLALFNLQRRKAVERYELYEPAFNALRDILDPRLPDHCLENILVRLSNEDWKNCMQV